MQATSTRRSRLILARALVLAYIVLVLATAAFVYATLNTHLFGPPDDSGLSGIWLFLVTFPASNVLGALPDGVLPSGDAALLVLVVAGLLQAALAWWAVSRRFRRTGASVVDQA